MQFPSLAHAQKYASDAYEQLKSAVIPSAEFLGNEVKGAGQMIMGLPSAIADSVTVAPTADEQKSLGVPANPTLAQKAALALYRNLGEPVQNAAQWYGTLVKHHQSIIDAIPQDVLAQGIGAGAGAAILGKVLTPGEEAAQPKPVVSATPTVKSVEAPNAENTVGTAEGAKQDTVLFAKAKAELGADASISDIAKRAQDMKVGTPLPKVKAAVAGRSVGAASINDLETKPDVPTFFSKAEQVINEKVSNNASGDQISALLKNNGVKPDEMKWAGLDDFLKDKPTVSKADLQQFIKENQIQLKDVDLGTPKRFTTQPNAEETAHAGEPMVDVIDPKNGLTRFTGSESSAKDYMSELGQGLSSDEEKELGLLKERTATLDAVRTNQLNALRNFGADSSAYQDASYRLQKATDSYTGGNRWNYDTINNANNARIMELENKAKQGATEAPTKFDKWVVPGEKENYQEKLLTLPTNESPELQTLRNEYAAAEAARNTYSQTGSGVVPGDVELRFQDAQNAMRKMKNEESTNRDYVGGHWGEEPNVVAHVRFDDRPAVDGKKTLFMEEAQSDWHSAGRHEGYRASVDPKELAQQLDNANDAYQAMSKKMAANPEDAQARADAQAAFQETQRLERAYNAAAAQRGVLDAPFKQSWHELVMKRMLRQAAENGYDRLAWTTGDQQADLYDLSKHIGKVEYDPEQNQLTAYDPKGKKVIDGESVEPTVKELTPYMGADLAEKLVGKIEDYELDRGPDQDALFDNYAQQYGIKEAEPNEGEEDQEPKYVVTTDYGEDEGPFDSEHEAQRWVDQRVRDEVQSELENYEQEKPELPSIEGLDLKHGGEFHRLLYDQMIPSFLKKYAKKWGAQVGTTEMKGMGEPELDYEGPTKTIQEVRALLSDPALSGTERHRAQEINNEMATHKLPFKDAVLATEQEANRQGYRGMDDLMERLGGKLIRSPGNATVHSIPITPEMRKSVMKVGQPISRNVAPPAFDWSKSALESLSA